MSRIGYRFSMMWSLVFIRSLPSLGRSYEVFGLGLLKGLLRRRLDPQDIWKTIVI